MVHEVIRTEIKEYQNRVGQTTFCFPLLLTSSDTCTLENGGPQGRFLSPLLFNFTINDILSPVPKRLKYSLYANDYAMWGVATIVSNAERLLQQGLDIAMAIFLVYVLSRTFLGKPMSNTYTSQRLRVLMSLNIYLENHGEPTECPLASYICI